MGKKDKVILRNLEVLESQDASTVKNVLNLSFDKVRFSQNSTLLIGLVLFLLSAFHNGIWFMPKAEESAAIAQNPFISPPIEPEAQYIFSSWLIHFVAFMAQAKTPGLFIGMNLLWTVVFCSLMGYYLKSRVGETQLFSSVYVFGLLPVSSFTFAWVGMDSLTLCLMMCILIFLEKSRIIPMAFGLLLGLQHFEVGFFSLAFCCLLAIARKDTLLFRWVWTIIFLVIGKLSLEGLFYLNNISYKSRIGWFLENANLPLEFMLRNPVALAYSGLGVLWLFFFYSLRSDPRMRSAGLLVIFLSFLLCSIVTDETRILCLSSFMVVCQLFTNEGKGGFDLVSRLKVWQGALFYLVPPVLILNGNIYTSVLVRDFQLFAVKILGLPPLDVSSWPFY